MNTKKTRAARGFFYMWVGVGCLPLVLLIILSVSIYWPYPLLFPRRVSLEYYQWVFNRNTVMAIISTVLLAFFTTALTLAVAVFAGKALAFYNFRGKKLVKILVLIPMIMPGVPIVIGAQLSLLRLSLTGTFLGVTLLHSLFALPYAIRIMTNVYETIGGRLEEQAAVLGAGTIYIFRKITLPRIMPGVLAAGTLSFAISISQYITTFMIGGGRIITLNILLVPHIQSGQTHIASVFSLLLIAASILSLAVMEFIIRRRYAYEGFYYV